MDEGVRVRFRVQNSPNLGGVNHERVRSPKAENPARSDSNRPFVSHLPDGKTYPDLVGEQNSKRIYPRTILR